MRYITFALAKGRLAKKAMEIMEKIGITCEEMKDEKTRKLIFANEELGFKFFLAKASDVPTYVEYGAADIGIVKLNGSVELAPIVGLSEVIVDIVETGTTLKENGLCVLEEVCDLSARIVVNQVSMKMENKRISEIIDKLKKLEEENR